jgi:hypothetical protein
VRRRWLNRAQRYLAAIRRRREALRKEAKRSAHPGILYFDGKPVASWIVPYLQWARHRGWRGYVTSGYRSYASQWFIYYIARIRPAARPGTSNHEGFVKPRGAVDVSDPYTLNRLLKQYPGGSELKWFGPGDVVHFSYTGR